MLAFEVILLASSLLLAGGEDVTSNDQSLDSNSKEVVTTIGSPEPTNTKTSTENSATINPVTTTTEKVVLSSKASASTKSLPPLSPTSNPPKLNSTTTPASGLASKGKRTLTESHFPIPFISFVVISLTGVILFFVYKRATDARWRVPPTYQYSVLNGWAGEQEEEEVAVLDIRAGDEWSTGSRDSSDVDMLGADDPSTLDMLSMENQNGPLVPGLGQTRRVSLPGDGMGGPGALSFVNGRVNSSILDDSDEDLLQP